MSIKDHDEIINAESCIDTLIECTEISKTEAYQTLRRGVNQLQKELEAAGVKGKWRTW